MAFWSFMNACRVLEWALYDSFIPLLLVLLNAVIFPIFSRSYRDFADFLPWFSYSRSNCIVLYCIYRSCSTSSASYFHDCRQTAQLLWLSINSITYISSFEHTLSVIYDRLCHIFSELFGELKHRIVVTVGRQWWRTWWRQFLSRRSTRSSRVAWRKPHSSTTPRCRRSPRLKVSFAQLCLLFVALVHRGTTRKQTWNHCCAIWCTADDTSLAIADHLLCCDWLGRLG